jgi:HEPN domain-containing protein/predicted nucleotidyltransferase
MIHDIKEEIKSKLAAAPFAIGASAVYGSWAKGTQTRDSDLDILMISDDINPKKHKRGREIVKIKERLSIGLPLDILLTTSEECISNFRNHNPLFLDIALEGTILTDKDKFLRGLINETLEYIVQKKLEKLADGWKFPVLYRQATFLSEVSNMDFAIVMLTDGGRDFNIGISLIRECFYDKAVYHFQQAVEKSVKAVLISFGEFKKSHFVGEILIDRLKDMELEQDWKEKLAVIAGISEEIEPEVTWSRYPGIDSGSLWIPYNEYTLEDAIEVKQKSEKVITGAKEFIQWWFKQV